MALCNIGIEFDVVGILEIEGDVILSYAAIHSDFLEKREQIDDYVPEDKDEMISYLEEINVPLNYKTFENRARKLRLPKLKDMYLANKLINNYGDIQRIDPTTLPDFDLFTYSFPCQDISVAGYQCGLNEDSGTRSSLLWECCKIIETKRPKYLMMGNVKNLVGKSHKDNFLKFLDYLESLGYKNSWAVLNVRDYGVPQNRERVFCISELEIKRDFVFPEPTELKFKLEDILEKDVDERYYLNNGQVMDKPIKQEYSYCLDSNYWKGTTLQELNVRKPISETVSIDTIGGVLNVSAQMLDSNLISVNDMLQDVGILIGRSIEKAAIDMIMNSSKVATYNFESGDDTGLTILKAQEKFKESAGSYANLNSMAVSYKSPTTLKSDIFENNRKVEPVELIKSYYGVDNIDIFGTAVCDGGSEMGDKTYIGMDYINPGIKLLYSRTTGITVAPLGPDGEMYDFYPLIEFMRKDIRDELPMYTKLFVLSSVGVLMNAPNRIIKGNFRA